MNVWNMSFPGVSADQPSWSAVTMSNTLWMCCTYRFLADPMSRVCAKDSRTWPDLFWSHASPCTLWSWSPKPGYSLERSGDIICKSRRAHLKKQDEDLEGRGLAQCSRDFNQVSHHRKKLPGDQFTTLELIETKKSWLKGFISCYLVLNSRRFTATYVSFVQLITDLHAHVNLGTCKKVWDMSCWMSHYSV